jgi:hypothetical protein
MDINELKLKDILSLQKLFSNESRNQILNHPYMEKYVILRSAPSGVHFGVFKSYDEQTHQIILGNSRRIHYWEKCFTLSAIANNGLPTEPTGTRISEVVAEMSIGYVCEIIPCSDIAIKSISNYPTHKI